MENPLSGLIKELTILPGIGEKSAQRLAFFFLSLPEGQVQKFAKVLVETKAAIKYCAKCFNISISDICHICADEKRNKSILCIVSEPRDVFSLEKMGEFKGVYHILGGLISPLDGVYPDALRIKELIDRLKNEHYEEVILAINSTVEGDATILYLAKYLKDFNIKLSKLAYGLPMGADIEYADEMTLQKAIQGRVPVL